MKKLRIAIDFDGTIVSDAYPNIGNMRGDAKMYINRLYDEGHTITINTCRTGKEEGAARAWLELIGIKFHWINTNRPEDIIKYNADCRKISADVHIDDKDLFALTYGMPTWIQIWGMIDTLANDDHE